MKERVKDILRLFHLYHPLQSAYRRTLFLIQRSKTRFQFSKYKGQGLICNVCGNAYSKFAGLNPSSENTRALSLNRVIAGYGKNILCPYCLSNARERLVLAMLTGKIDCTGKRILHLSPEKNIHDYLNKIAAVTTADLLPGFYRSIDRKVSKQDATQLTFYDASFDMVIANHILEHIPDDIDAMNEIKRVLKPGGRAILQVPYSTSNTTTLEHAAKGDVKMQSLLYGQKDHVRIYTLDDFINRLKSVGFEVSIIPYSSLEEYHRFAIQQEEVFINIEKPSGFQ